MGWERACAWWGWGLMFMIMCFGRGEWMAGVGLTAIMSYVDVHKHGQRSAVVVMRRNHQSQGSVRNQILCIWNIAHWPPVNNNSQRVSSDIRKQFQLLNLSHDLNIQSQQWHIQRGHNLSEFPRALANPVRLWHYFRTLDTESSSTKSQSPGQFWM